MTFTEAAVEVLRLVGRPLHYKKITEIAVERNLLSHVGKSPEITMSSRLATMVKKDRGEAPIVKVKPGIFGLREFSKEVLAMGELEEGDVEDILEAIDEAAEAGEVEAADEAADVDEAGEAAAPAPVEPEKVQKPAHKLPGQEVFPEEDDDDEPILGRADESGSESDSDEARRNGKKRRRKKRRGGEGESGSDAETRDEPREAQPGRDRHRERGERDRGGRDRDRGGRDRDRGDRDRGDRDRGDRGRDRDAERVSRREPEVRGDWQREPGEGDLAGKELSDAIEAALVSRGSRASAFVDIADLLVQRGRLQGDPSALAPTIAAAVRGDVARRAATSQKPRFRVRFGEVSLLDQLLGPEVARAEQEAQRALSRHRELVHRGLVRKLAELPNASLLEILASWLNSVGVTSLRGVRRTGAAAGEFHLAGVMRRGQEEVPLAVVIVRDGQVGRERVIDVRGSLHRYGDARLAWIVTLGNVQGGARDEASELGGAPVALFDGMQLARSLEDAGVGVRRYSVPLLALDFDLFDELRGPGAPPRPPREPERGDNRPARVQSKPEPAMDDEADEDSELEPEDSESASTAVGAEAAESADASDRKKRRRRRRRRRRGGAEEGAGEEVAGEADRGASADDDADGDGDDEAEERGAHESSEFAGVGARVSDEDGDLERRDDEIDDDEDVDRDPADDRDDLDDDRGDDEDDRLRELDDERDSEFDEDLDDDDLDDDRDTHDSDDLDDDLEPSDEDDDSDDEDDEQDDEDDRR